MEFLLQGNEITAKSLPKLAEVVSLSAGDLREFDFSKNNIQIRTAEEKAMWQGFLESFRDCYMLKKLDLGYNNLGTAGMEILARVYIQSDLDFLEVDAEDVLGSMHEEDLGLAEEMESLKLMSGKENEPVRDWPKKSTNKSKGSSLAPLGNFANVIYPGRSSSSQVNCKAITQADLKRYACTRGLRSIPYLILSNTCASNAGAVHLSSMLNIQRSPEQLLAFLPPGKALTLPGMTSKCKGIIWLPNDELDPLARKMIDTGESVRQLSMDSHSEDESYTRSFIGRGQTFAESLDSNRDATSKRKLQKKLDVEYMRIAKRVRMETLKNSSVHEVELWSTALKMMLVCRALLLDDGDRIAETGLDSQRDDAEPHEPKPRNGNHSQEQRHRYPFMDDNFYSGSEWSDVAEVSNKARRIPIAQVTEDSEHEASNAGPATQTTASRQTKCNSRANPSPSATSKPNGRYGLPIQLWRRIIAEAVNADGILTRNQQMQIMQYATDWDVIAYKLTIKGVEDYQQIWKFLETVDCFTYSALS